MLTTAIIVMLAWRAPQPGEDRPDPSAQFAALADEQPDRYEPFELLGFRGMMQAQWARSSPVQARRVLAALETDLKAIEAVVPGPALDLLRARNTLWISPRLAERPGFSGRGMCFHESREWVSGHGLGAERFRGIEICNADDYLLWRAEQPMMVLHELAHAYHEAIRPDDDDLRAAFQQAVSSGRYERVAHVLAGPGELRRAYAITNDREYFAELTEAYFGRNDFAPMDRPALLEFDPEGARAVSDAWARPARGGGAPSP